MTDDEKRIFELEAAIRNMRQICSTGRQEVAALVSVITGLPLDKNNVTAHNRTVGRNRFSDAKQESYSMYVSHKNQEVVLMVDQQENHHEAITVTGRKRNMSWSSLNEWSLAKEEDINFFFESLMLNVCRSRNISPIAIS